MGDALGALEARLGHVFRERALLEEALTHRSFANEHPGARDNERLAFLGDAVLALVVAEHLRAADPAAPVGVLTPRRAALVSGAEPRPLGGASSSSAPISGSAAGSSRRGGRARSPSSPPPSRRWWAPSTSRPGCRGRGAWSPPWPCGSVKPMRLWPFSRRATRPLDAAPSEGLLALQDLARRNVDDVLAVSEAGARGNAFIFGGELLVEPGRALRLLEPRLKPFGYAPFINGEGGRTWIQVLPLGEVTERARPGLNLLLFVLTLLSTLAAGSMVAGSFPWVTFDPLDRAVAAARRAAVRADAARHPGHP